MGGPRKRTEPPNCSALKQNANLWRLFSRAGMVSFFKAMKGYNESLIAKLTNSWRKGQVVIGAVRFEVTTQFIVEVTGLEN